MKAAAPLHCRADAFELFAWAMPRIESSEGLFRAALALAKHDIPSVDPASTSAELDRFACDIRERVRSSSQQALLAHAHRVLFEERGFGGELEDYDNPHNTYLPLVLQSRRGLPITLSLIYKLVLDRIGLSAVGLNAPMHFLAGVDIDGQRLIIDPYYNGRMLSRPEALERIEQMIGRPIPQGAEALPVATHRQWIDRMIANLLNVFRIRNRPRDFAAIMELRALLGPAAERL